MALTITPNTQLCVSLAQRPGRYGITVHNAGYKALGLDFIYKACAVVDLHEAIAGVRALGIRGASISMPFKEPVMALLDAVDDSAREVGAVNTVVNDAGKLTGYNTDVLAARAALARVGSAPQQRVLLLGAGGVARAVRSALVATGVRHVYVSARQLDRVQTFIAGTTMAAVPWHERQNVAADIIINATPVGMSPHELSSPLEDHDLRNRRAVIEIVASPAETLLLRYARARGLANSSGPEFALDQALAQFELYTGHSAPREVMAKALESLT